LAQRLPSLIEGEQVILHQQGGYLSRGSWKLGYLYLTNRALLFCQAKRVIVNLALRSIKAVGLKKSPFILATKNCLRLSYRAGSTGAIREATFITAHLDLWWRKIVGLLEAEGIEVEMQSVTTADALAQDRAGRIRTKIDGDSSQGIREGDIKMVIEELDPVSAQMVWYLWENRHAKIEELRRAVGESSHMKVLVRIREVINPKAHKMLGKPLLVFERARIDHKSGERILYSWWLSGDGERGLIEGEGLVDVLDEEDHTLVIVELVGFEETGIQLTVEDERLVVKAEAPGRWVREEIPLSPQVHGQRFRASYHNNLLQVRFEKERAR